MARFSLYPVSNTKLESAPSQFGNPGSSNWNIKQSVPVADFLAWHNCGMIWIVVWDELSYPDGVYFQSRRDTPQESSSNCATLIFEHFYRKRLEAENDRDFSPLDLSDTSGVGSRVFVSLVLGVIRSLS